MGTPESPLIGKLRPEADGQTRRAENPLKTARLRAERNLGASRRNAVGPRLDERVSRNTVAVRLYLRFDNGVLAL